MFFTSELSIPKKHRVVNLNLFEPCFGITSLLFSPSLTLAVYVVRHAPRSNCYRRCSADRSRIHLLLYRGLGRASQAGSLSGRKLAQLEQARLYTVWWSSRVMLLGFSGRPWITDNNPVLNNYSTFFLKKKCLSNRPRDHRHNAIHG